eukprot:TRINITY_DN2456_c0_g1_i7.p2 TRINITY_DN2456_c0_g1~~TRINITY_DN2456_c0_g1_i7.p2  ORF type:complete len:159 (-),score=39.99 TRINITY_DN2456_c0_g1_i7:358-834(-)
MVVLPVGTETLLLPTTDYMKRFTGEDHKPSTSDLSALFDQYDKDGNGTLDHVEVGCFWRDVFEQHTGMSEAQKNEAVTHAVEDTFELYDDIQHDGKIDKDEFLLHFQGAVFPSFPTCPSDVLPPMSPKPRAPAVVDRLPAPIENPMLLFYYGRGSGLY